MTAMLNLRALRLRAGEQYRMQEQLTLEPFELGGQVYAPDPGTVDADVVVTRATTGTVFELAFSTRFHGPCFRCLEDASLGIEVRAREYQATKPEGDEELMTAYLHEDRLDLEEWARDAIADLLPEQILCRDDCAGLCPECGLDLNVTPHEHETEGGDPRWGALANLKRQL